ncbi:sarcosine oxidase subunit gamma family protein [Sandaracinobacteroides saxicola]|uniref:Sarcosine oxidase subunit gamma n=1 Tax=Sandaracinobacteroides saxicola TaxID=2759707 RepID=A0A7G5II78_9SPHN|nr:sarcosine oxidase subunit gamma family protein [Sandaracinobacteroides saxicola]QMW23070.1 sarcosine oxidase subunit gamma [Sandaracinobacteroides saxicola]
MAELARMPDRAMLVLRSRDAAACGLPVGVGSAAAWRGGTAVWIGPDEWLLIGGDGVGGDDAPALLAGCAGLPLVAVDVSGNRSLYRLHGADAGAVLARGCSLDLAGLAVGTGWSTLLARAQLVLLVAADGYRLLPRRSFGRYLEAWFQAVGVAVAERS